MHEQLPRRLPAVWGRHLREREILANLPRQNKGVNPSGNGFPLTAPLTLTISEPLTAPVQTLTQNKNPLPSSTPSPPATPLSSPSPPSSPVPSPPADVQTSALPATSGPSSSAIPSSTPSAAASSNQALAASHLPGGTVAAIAIVCVLGLLGLLVFLIRKRYISTRRKKTVAWGAGIMNTPVSSADAGFNHTVTTSMDSTGHQPTYSSGQLSPSLGSSVTPPPMSYNNPIPPLLSGIPSPGPTSPTTGSHPPLPSSIATVQCTFIPTLPDELSILTGEIVRILDEFDDGWAFCVNGRGEKGMVPLECLDRAETGLRHSKRVSSLAGGGSGIGGQH